MVAFRKFLHINDTLIAFSGPSPGCCIFWLRHRPEQLDAVLAAYSGLAAHDDDCLPRSILSRWESYELGKMIEHVSTVFVMAALGMLDLPGDSAPIAIVPSLGPVYPMEMFTWVAYLIIVFYPQDFTYVCPTEIIAFSDRLAEFRDIDTDVIALSEKGGVGNVKIPLLSDATRQISKDYGVYDEDLGFAIRGLFIVDPKESW
ncbi:putative Peroxiredoxin-4 [Hypsibius exemplaris]|uniref:thioredoxin-dependent peroxiredoxin n=1 Tax=Hypsibius exemplaris TaxID=2072580 RepID=A0A1W0WGM5_HYPEX|nr:putative Peroxiredoxin-4 [Hypsibius exemplaris]